MADKWTGEELEELRGGFKTFDQNDDGHITATELRVVFKNLGLKKSEEEIQKMIAEVDTNENGTIEFEEFAAMVAKQKEIQQAELRELFGFFDKDGDGFITPAELKTVMNQLGEDLTDDEIKLMINEADLDGDGNLNYMEFEKMFACQLKKK